MTNRDMIDLISGLSSLPEEEKKMHIDALKPRTCNLTEKEWMKKVNEANLPALLKERLHIENVLNNKVKNPSKDSHGVDNYDAAKKRLGVIGKIIAQHTDVTSTL